MRSYTYNALTLRVKPSGESNREAWFLTAEEGIIKATVFGGPKSRLRARVAPYHEGKLWIYRDPVRDSRKVSDFDVQLYRTGIRELYERAMCSGAVAETILAFSGGGYGGEEALKLAGDVLNALEGADAASASRLIVYFLWHWAGILGEKPDLFDNFDETLAHLGGGAVNWLKAIDSLPALAVLRVTLDSASMEQAKKFTKTVLANSLGRKLPTWENI